MAQSKLGIDLGAATVCIAAPEQGVVLHQASMAAVDKRQDKVIALGDEALAMVGRTPGYIVTTPPFVGAGRSHALAVKMLREFLVLAGAQAGRLSAAAVCMPSAMSEVERDALAAEIVKAGARRVYLIDSALAAAIGGGLDPMSAQGCLVVDIGASSTDVAVIGMGGRVSAASTPAAGLALDEAIIKYMRASHGMEIGPRTAEQLKTQIAACKKSDFSENMEVKGRSLESGLPQRIIMNTMELYDTVEAATAPIAETIRQVLERTPPELSADIYESGLLLTGGGACLHGLAEYMSGALSLPVRLAEAPAHCAALGALQSLSMADTLKNGFTDVTERALTLWK